MSEGTPENPFAANEQGAEHETEEVVEQHGEEQAQPEPVVVHTAESILTAMLEELEGVPHMSKTEIVAVLDKYRAQAATL